MAASKLIAGILADRDLVKYKSIIERAALNGYHDFKFDNIPGHPEYGECISPKMQLVEDLSRFPELHDIVMDVVIGKYDDDPDEIDDANLRVMLMNENVSDAFMKAIGLEPPSEEERQSFVNSKLN